MMGEEIVLPVWFVLGLFVVFLAALVVAVSCAEASLHTVGRVRELRWVIRQKEREIRRLHQHTRLASWRPPPAPVAEPERWADPEPEQLIAVEAAMEDLDLWVVRGTWPDPPALDTADAVVVELPLTEPIEVVDDSVEAAS